MPWQLSPLRVNRSILIIVRSLGRPALLLRSCGTLVRATAPAWSAGSDSIAGAERRLQLEVEQEIALRTRETRVDLADGLQHASIVPIGIGEGAEEPADALVKLSQQRHDVE